MWKYKQICSNIYIYIYIYIYVHIHTYIYIYLHQYSHFLFTRKHICLNIHKYASVCFVKFGSAAVSAAHARSVSLSPFSSPILDLPISHCRIGPPCLAVLVLRILLRCLRRCSTYLLWLPGFSFQSPAAFDPRASSST